MTSRLRIDLGALAGNYRTFTAKAAGEVAAVVKADAYGVGAASVAERLWSVHCREFFVATAEEGVALRQLLPGSAQIYVLEGALADSVVELKTHKLIPVLNTRTQCELWADSGVPAGLHIDTGMQRLGLPIDEVGSVVTGSRLELGLLLSHLANADEPEDPFNQVQVERIREAFQGLSTLYPNLRLSLANSAGMLEGIGPEHLGRAGIGLYGGNPYAGRTNPMLPVVSLEGQVLQIRRLEANTPVGYGGSYVTARESRIATVGTGYADGVPRLLSSQGSVYVDGAFCPIVGRVSMDMLTVDVSDASVEEGQWVEFFGSNIPVDEVAEQAETLAYEILTGLGSRPTRQYLN